MLNKRQMALLSDLALLQEKGLVQGPQKCVAIANGVEQTTALLIGTVTPDGHKFLDKLEAQKVTYDDPEGVGHYRG